MSNNYSLISAGLSLLEVGMREGRRNSSVVVQPLVANADVALALMAPPVPAFDTINLVDLKRKLNDAFNDDEFQDICFTLNVDYDNLREDTLNGKIRELILLFKRRDQLPELVKAAARLRPERNWEVGPDVNAQFEPQLDIAVVVDMTLRSIPLGVARFLDDRNIPANFVLMRSADGEFLSPTKADWPAVVKGFSAAMTAVKRTHTGASTHFFLSGPGTVLFGLGCMWGTVDEATVYHYENNTYHEVFATGRELR